MASQGKNSSSGTRVRSFFCGRFFRKNRGLHNQEATDDDTNINMSNYDLALNNQFFDDDV